MKANELMIGDWVYEGKEHLIKVRQNYGKSIRYDERDYSHEVEENCLFPIPITAEILEKNGFVKVNSQWYDYGNPNMYGYININPKKKIIHINGANYSNANLYYLIAVFNVHELQHALRLCGLNELADNFKI